MTDTSQDWTKSKLAALPARLTPAQVAAELGMRPEDISVLVHLRLLKPLGHPPRNGSKYFAAAAVLRSAADESWLARASDAIVAHHHHRNHRDEQTS